MVWKHKIRVLLCSLTGLILGGESVSALQITPILVEGEPDERAVFGDGHFTGNSQEIIEAAANWWEDVIGDPGRETISYGWRNLPPGRVGETDRFGNVSFDNWRGTLYYFDPIPTNNREYEALVGIAGIGDSHDCFQKYVV